MLGAREMFPRSLNQPSPPTSISPVPPQVWHSPLPPQMEQEDSSPNAARSSSPAGFPLPWQPAQLPSPGESQLWQVRVVMLHLPSLFRDSDPGSCVCQTEAVGDSGQVCPLPGLSRTGTPACPRAVWRYCAGQPRVSVLPSNLRHCPVGAAFSQT